MTKDERQEKIIAAIQALWDRDEPPTLRSIAAEVGLNPPKNYISLIRGDILKLVKDDRLGWVEVPYSGSTRMAPRVVGHVEEEAG